MNRNHQYNDALQISSPVYVISPDQSVDIAIYIRDPSIV